jgi:hypothetical protein
MDSSSDRTTPPVAAFPETQVRRVQSSDGLAVEAIRDGSEMHMRRPGDPWRSVPYVLAFELLVELLELDTTNADQVAEAHLLLRVLNAGGASSAAG